MAYTLTLTTLAKVRSEAGFTNNTNIDDTNDVTPHTEDAEGEVYSAVSQIYTLPLSDNSYWADSPGEAFLSGITTRLAAGLLMLKMYEGQGGVILEKANEKVDRAREQLKMILDRTFVLIDSQGNEIATRDSALTGLSGLPNSGNAPYEAKFKMGTIF